jgi:hypothetical protein
MKTLSLTPSALALLLASCCAVAGATPAEHREFEATLHAPFRPDPTRDAAGLGARTFTVSFDYPGLERAHVVDWRLELVAPSGAVVRRWQGSSPLFREPVSIDLQWHEGEAGMARETGIHRARLSASVRDPAAPEAEIEVIDQSWDIAVGQGATPAMPLFAPLPTPRSTPPALQAAPAPAALPYTVYYGNLHSQTNHSDGGAALDSCKGAQDPLTAKYGPEAAFDFARERGLDILVASEHNHMYDGSDGTDPKADPAKAKGLYQAGLAAAAAYSAANPGFLAVYGLEWGVINNGGHVNIFNSPDLLGWEVNAKGELMADTATPRNDYAALYALMKQRGWVGQFNHPAQSGQFIVNGKSFGYTPEGDEVMALCEVMNSTAFSTNVTETETRRSNYEVACNKLLEAGFHVAFSTNQDNHCANWGASYTNRTGVLIPTGTPLTHASFIDAIKARRVFATMDKLSQLVLTANGHMMGERFVNSGPLTLVANFANAAGKAVAAVAIMEGVPGRNGTVTELAATGTTTFTPSPGEHFYYAKVTQDDGRVLWSAPVWVTQRTTLAK